MKVDSMNLYTEKSTAGRSKWKNFTNKNQKNFTKN